MKRNCPKTKQQLSVSKRQVSTFLRILLFSISIMSDSSSEEVPSDSASSDGEEISSYDEDFEHINVRPSGSSLLFFLPYFFSLEY